MSHPGRPAPADANPALETLEGWWLLHDLLYIDRDAWQDADRDWRDQAMAELVEWLAAQAAIDGGTGAYAMLGHKADLMLIHHRADVAGLHAAENGLRSLQIAQVLSPATSYVSIAEASLYEATGAAHGRLAQRGLSPGKDGFDEAFAEELATQQGLLKDRVFRTVPEKAYVCYYPMSKRRGEQENWYAMPLDERRCLDARPWQARSQIQRLRHPDHRWLDRPDDWEWSVDLHSDDMLVFKKLVYEMRFDPASARFAEFGPFYVGSRCIDAAALVATFGG